MNLNRQILEVERILRRTIPKMIAIELDLGNPVRRINADPTQTEQLLMNLALNARDAMQDGGTLRIVTRNVTLDDDFCRSHVGARPGEHVVLTVSDTGHGMDEETLNHIFEPFYTTKELGRGTGLGLAMVYGIVNQHEGIIVCQSEVGRGTSFHVYLPSIESEEETSASISQETPSFGTETVLLVDDEEFVRELGERILNRAGYTVLTASGVDEAKEIFRREGKRISLVILDLIMPETGGKDCLREFIKIEPGVKVLVASGQSDDISRRETLELGAGGFVSKPFLANNLLRQVRRVLDKD